MPRISSISTCTGEYPPMSAFNWTSLPHEMKLAVLDHLPLPDVWNCSRTSRDSYSVCLPLLFKTVHLPSLPAVSRFLQAVPAHHLSLVRHLSIATQPPNDHHQHHNQPQLSSASDINNDPHYQAYDTFTHPDPKDADAVANPALVALLSACTSLDSLDIKLAGRLDPASIIPLFSRLERLSKLSIESLELEEVAPLSERLVVSLAFSLPRLEDLSLTRITRSAIHAPELHHSNVPTVTGDDDDSVIPPHPLLGRELRLPQLLRLPTLRRLTIRDTHLGDPMWARANDDDDDGEDEVTCPLETLDLGSCAHVSPALNELYTARIMARAPPSITSCALSASLPPPSSSTRQAYSPDSPTCKSPYSSSSSSSSPISPISPISPMTPAQAQWPAAPSPTFNFSQSQSKGLGIPPLPRLHTLHLTPLVPTSALAHTLAQPALAASPVRTLSCAFHPDDVREGCEVLEAFLRERERCGEAEAEAEAGMGMGGRRTRKRAASRLSVCSGLADEDDEDAAAHTRANTVPSLSVSPSSSPSPAPSRLYASLSTLRIDIPADPSSPLSPNGGGGGARLSPRRLAAARRRAEERREAAGRLEVLARSLGLDIFVRGLEAGDGGDGDANTNEGAGSGKKGAGVPSLRARANSA